jgi:two-component sensor histidine kinase
MRLFRLFTSYLLLSWAFFAPGWVQSQSRNLDSLYALLKQSRPDSNRVRLLLVLADRYQNDTANKSKSKLDTALGYARQAEALSRPLGFHQLIAESLIAKSKTLMDVRNHSSTRRKEARTALEEVLKRHLSPGDVSQRAEVTYLIGESFPTPDTARLPYLQSALTLYETLGNGRKMAVILVEMGETFRLVGNVQEALRMYLTALSLQKPIHDPEISGTLARLAILYERIGNYPTALTHAYQAHQLALASGDVNQIINSLRSLSVIHSALGDKKQATHYLRSLLAITLKIHHSQGIVRARLDLCTSLLRQGYNQAALTQAQLAFKLIQTEVPEFRPNCLRTLGDCYLALGAYTTAERYYLEGIDEYTPVERLRVVNSYLKLGRVTLATNRLAKASSYLTKALVIAQVNNIGVDLKSDILLELYRLDSVRNDYKAALDHFRQYTALKDSLFNETKSRQIAGLQIQFDVENKENNIRLLQQRNAVQQSRLQQAQQHQISIIIGAFLLLLLLIVTYNRYRLRQRNNQLLQAQQQKLQAQHQALQTQQEEINYRNEDLQRLLTEKERLLKEIHHRVKNNLQVVMSLLNSQAAYLSDETALSVIQESQHRVQAMALIHQKLYQAEGVARIPMAEYIPELVAYLRDSYDLPQSIRFMVEVAPIELDITQAVPLGLIINEAINNALKYAFPSGRSGTIELAFHQLATATYQLSIIDDGVGLPPTYNPERSRSLGMTLMHGFSEQLGAALTISSPPGVTVRLVFTEETIRSTYRDAGFIHR